MVETSLTILIVSGAVLFLVLRAVNRFKKVSSPPETISKSESCDLNICQNCQGDCLEIKSAISRKISALDQGEAPEAMPKHCRGSTTKSQKRKTSEISEVISR